MFQGFNTDDPVNTASLICGFVIIFAGVYLLDSIARGNNSGSHERSGRHNDEEIYDEDERLLLSEATLMDNEEALGLTEFNGSNNNINQHHHNTSRSSGRNTPSSPRSPR